ncbi:MAG: N-acetyltransferase [Herminiimonas sp.]|nr:N-acetyltransferase [Herminiimonas sp.]
MDPLQSRIAPTLRTERLQLVALQSEHFNAFADLHADPQTMQYIGDGHSLDQVEAWLHLAMLLGHWHLRGYGVWAVEERGKEGLVGRSGLLHPEGWPDPELSWMIAPSMRGRGYAVEAARAVLDFSFRGLGLERVISLVRPGNVGSARVAARLGGVLVETIDFLGSPMQVFRYTPTT